jgi:hypothetical protein
MSKDDKKAAMAVALPEGFSEIKLDRLVYKPESCGDTPLVGWLLAKIDLPGAEGNPDWTALIIKATQVTKGVNRDGEVVAVPVGDEVLIPATAKLMQAFSKAADVQDKVFQIFIKPTNKTKLDGVRSMWNYTTGLHKESRARDGEFAIVGGGMTKALNGGEAAATA